MLMGCHSTPHYRSVRRRVVRPQLPFLTLPTLRSLFHTASKTPLLFLDCSPHALASEEAAATAGLTLDYTQVYPRTLDTILPLSPCYISPL
jgi:hypothetical protein